MSGHDLPVIGGEYTQNALYARFIDVPESEFEAGSQPLPDWNGRLLMNPAGTVWVVIDGVARGYVNEPLFARVHGWRRQKQFCGGPLGHESCSWNWVNTVFHRIPSISVIQEGAPISTDATIISNPAGTMFFFENNTIRGIPAAHIMEKYQFNWDTGKSNRYSDDVIVRLQSVGIIE
ncbi:MAG: hypothetical protein NTU79_06385 [Planctomycetota bacterium]|nr:hypothetical protein [Planctomycetota bacterium]